jgi:hypothetical protein
LNFHIWELRTYVKVGEEIVDSLRKDSCPVYRVYGTELVLGIKFAVPEEVFDDILESFLSED